jgi:hypothetical protein
MPTVRLICIRTVSSAVLHPPHQGPAPTSAAGWRFRSLGLGLTCRSRCRPSIATKEPGANVQADARRASSAATGLSIGYLRCLYDRFHGTRFLSLKPPAAGSAAGKHQAGLPHRQSQFLRVGASAVIGG